MKDRRDIILKKKYKNYWRVVNIINIQIDGKTIVIINKNNKKHKLGSSFKSNYMIEH